MTLLEDLDALDRMVENGAPKAEIRSQIRVITNGVAALEEAYAALRQDHAKLQKSKEDADRLAAEADRRRLSDMDDALRADLHKQSETRKRRTLHNE